MLKKKLMGHLRSKRRIRRSQHSGVGGQSRGQIVDAVSIRQRPTEFQDRAIPEHVDQNLVSVIKRFWLHSFGSAVDPHSNAQFR